MATTVSIPAEEYLQTVYRPDCDFVDGEVEERNVGEEQHGLVQLAIGSIFRENRRAWGLSPITEQRVQVSDTRFRIPDVCVVPLSQPLQGVLRTPPVLCVEVLSPEDRYQRVQERVSDYLNMGVPAVWLVDPISREIWVSTLAGTVPFRGEVLTLQGYPVELPVVSIFEELDERGRI